MVVKKTPQKEREKTDNEKNGRDGYKIFTKNEKQDRVKNAITNEEWGESPIFDKENNRQSDFAGDSATFSP